MSAAQTVPIFDPSGVLRDVPYEQMRDAVANGGKPGVRFQAPDKTVRYVPADQTQDAVKHGGTLLPVEQQDVQQPGFWHAIHDDLSGALTGLPSMLRTALPSSMPQPISQAVSSTLQNLENEKAAGRNLPYRAGATVAGLAGTNVAGMEQAAEQGDPGAVLGHAAAGAAPLVAGEVARTAVPSVAELAKNPTLVNVAGSTADIAKGAAKLGDIATFERLGKALGTVRDTLAKVEGRFSDPTASNVPYAGEAEPPASTSAPAAAEAQPAPSLSKPKAKTVKQSAALGPNAQVQTQAQALAQPRTVVIDPQTGAPEFSDVLAAQQQAAASPASAATAAMSEYSPAAQSILDKLKQNVSNISAEESAKAAEPQPEEDLTDLLQKSLDAVKRKKAGSQSAAAQTVGSISAAMEDSASFHQALQELGKDAPLSKVAQRAQEIKVQKLQQTTTVQ